jgi:hypothetical protein
MVQKKATLPDNGSLLDASIHHDQTDKTNLGILAFKEREGFRNKG